ncbi:DUF5131 family protein [Sphingomonas sp. SFZ2018-12]|uniref:phage Gp37/Gp68 family protein n=1 Tax=Sphingomonas sp. SFZ2018-12 TaxID=2683197 RepID=UPI001F10BD6A|nr:phage Gp37/Gp68 family protein [Sphingomonas sp. SFZ2018-12]MCH4893969.1 DUF5131 family protein [Sphingomonas sp. SFZ2018-12]
MSDGTKIEWTDATVNAVNGCSVLSPGCTNCYAMRSGGRNLPHHPATGLTQPSKAGHVWTGEVRLNETQMLQPLKWRKPRRIFWNAHGDLFHENVPDEWIDRVFAVCALTPHHTHQILTKRSDRMRRYITDRARMDWLNAEIEQIGLVANLPTNCVCRCDRDDGDIKWPLANVWLGVSVEDQQRANERIPDLLATPAAVRWISAEPLLGPIDLGVLQSGLPVNAWLTWLDGLDWVVVGGESGPGARPMLPDWARALRDQCAAVGVPFFFKQWGSCLPGNMDGEDENGRPAYEIEEEHCEVDYDDLGRGKLIQAHGREFICFGHKHTGRRLDGVRHDGYPA